MKKLLLMLLLIGISFQSLDAACRGDLDGSSSKSAEELSQPLDAQEGLNNALIQAAARGNAAEAERLIEAGAQVNTQPWPLRQTPLHYAAQTGSMPCVELFLRHGALVNKQDLEGFTPLLTAAAKGKSEIIKLLLNAGALPDLPSYKGATALYHATRKGYRDLAKILLEAGACVNFQGIDRIIPLQLALGTNDLELAKLFLEYGADPNFEIVSDGALRLTLFAYEIKKKEPCSKKIRLMLEHGANPDVQLIGALTPLMFAMTKGMHGAVQAMLEYGANITPEITKYAATSPNKLIRRFIENKSRLRTATAESKRDAQDQKTIEELAAELRLDSHPAKKGTKTTQSKKSKQKPAKKHPHNAAGAPVQDEVVAVEPTAESPRSEEDDSLAYLAMIEPAPTASTGAAAGSASDEEEQTTASIHVGRAGVINFNFSPTTAEATGNAIAFGPATKRIMHNLCVLDNAEERALMAFSEKRYDTAGGLMLLDPRIQEKFSSLVRTREEGLNQDVVDHLVSTELMLKALRYGSCYLAIDTTALVVKPYLMVVAPIERTLSAGLSDFASNVKNYLTLCFSIDREGSINHCYHFCAQNKHPYETTTEAGLAKYKLKPIATKAKIKKRGTHYKLKLEFVRHEDFRTAAQELR